MRNDEKRTGNSEGLYIPNHTFDNYFFQFDNPQSNFRIQDAFKLNKCKYKDPPLANRCQICPASFGKPSDLIRHSRVHTREKPFACKTCGDSFSIKSTLLIHERKHVAAQKRIKYMCQVIPFAYKFYYSYSVFDTIDPFYRF